MMNTLCKNQKASISEGDDSLWYNTSGGLILPRYPNASGCGISPGLYIGLWHGRKTPNEEMNDWGFDGPMIGPLSSIRTTYMGSLRLNFMDPNIAKCYFPRKDEWILDTVENMIEFYGCYFGEWTVFVHPDPV